MKMSLGASSGAHYFDGLPYPDAGCLKSGCDTQRAANSGRWPRSIGVP